MEASAFFHSRPPYYAHKIDITTNFLVMMFQHICCFKEKELIYK
jgi:hypothetical protein